MDEYVLPIAGKDLQEQSPYMGPWNLFSAAKENERRDRGMVARPEAVRDLGSCSLSARVKGAGRSLFDGGSNEDEEASSSPHGKGRHGKGATARAAKQLESSAFHGGEALHTDYSDSD